MRAYQIKLLSLLFLMGLFTQSCTPEDEELIQGEISEFQQGGQNGPPKNGPQSHPVSQLDNSIALEWMDVFLEIDRYATGMRPNATARALAYINLAAFETAVPGMRNFVSNSNHLDGLQITPSENLGKVDWEVALNECYADVMDHFIRNVPAGLKVKIATTKADNLEDLSSGIASDLIVNSRNWGAYIADQIILYSQTDKEAEEQIYEPQPTSYEPPTGDGYWTYSAEQERALFPYWRSVRTFVIAPSETTSVPPIAYSDAPSSPYFKEMMEVYEANNTAKAEDNEQLWIAEFWSDDVENLVFSPPARQISICNQMTDKRSLNLEKALYLYLKLGFSLNDAAVSTWKYKYDYMVMRPNVYIQEFIDADFETNLFRLIPWSNPTFPGYPSGHSCFASAAGGVFIEFFGNPINFTDRSHEGRTEFRGTPRSFTSFQQLADENGYSRIPLGVHLRMDCKEGLRLGYEISDAVKAYNLKKPNI